MSAAGEAERLREQGEAEARSARLRARAASDNAYGAGLQHPDEDARRAGAARLLGGRLADNRIFSHRKEAEA